MNHLSAFLAHSPVPMIMVDTEMRIIGATNKWLSRYNLPLAQMLGKELYEINPYIPERWKQIHQNCLTGHSDHCDNDVYLLHGKYEHVKWEVNPWKNSDGSIGGLIIYSEIITDNVVKDKNIARLFKELKMLTNVKDITFTSTDDFDIIDQVCKEISATGGYELIWFGYAPDTTIDKRLISPLHKYGRAIHYLDNFYIDLNLDAHKVGPAATAIFTGEVVVVNDYFTDRRTVPWVENARRHNISSSLTIPVIFSNGQRGIFAIYSSELNAFSDEEIDVLKRVADFAIFAVNNIQRIYEQKVAKIKKDKLIRDLNARNRSLEEFTYMVSHNLRTKVANILGSARLLIDEGMQPGDQKALLKGIKESTKKLDELISDLSSILLVNKHLTVNNEKVNLERILELLSDQIQSRYAHRKVVIGYDLSAIKMFYSDSYYLYDLLCQLFQSIIKQRDPEIRQEIFVQTGTKNDYVIIDVTDRFTGIQMKDGPAEIFEVYSKLYQHLTDGGIKLFYVNAIVENLGGRLHAEAVNKTEMVFHIELPQNQTGLERSYTTHALNIQP